MIIDSRNLPRFYKTMYQDGYTPEEILVAVRAEMRERIDRMKVAAESDDYNLNINSSVEVKK